PGRRTDNRRESRGRSDPADQRRCAGSTEQSIAPAIEIARSREGAHREMGWPLSAMVDGGEYSRRPEHPVPVAAARRCEQVTKGNRAGWQQPARKTDQCRQGVKATTNCEDSAPLRLVSTLIITPVLPASDVSRQPFCFLHRRN